MIVILPGNWIYAINNITLVPTTSYSTYGPTPAPSQEFYIGAILPDKETSSFFSKNIQVS